MDSAYRKEALQHVNQKAIANTSLPELEREYTLNEIAIITRAGPARALGLQNKGHLGVGADADITIYTEDEDREQMFNAPRYVIKDGIPVIKDHEFVTDHKGKILHSKPGYNEDISGEIEPFFEDYYSVKFSNYAISDDYLHCLLYTSPSPRDS